MFSKNPILLFVILLPVIGLAQIDDLAVDTTWRSGSVLLNDNSVHKGFVKFDRVSALAAFKNTLQSEEETFLQTRIVAAEVFDVDQMSTRRFARFDVGKESALCEILMETRTFMVLSYVGLEISTVASTATYNGLATGPPTIRVKGHSMSETILFAPSDGQSPAEVILYAPNFQRKGRQMTDFWLKHRPIFFEEKLAFFMQSHESQIRKHLKDHKIKAVKNGEANLEIREQVFDVIKYYKSLEDAE
jgi:hypothetical protein